MLPTEKKENVIYKQIDKIINDVEDFYQLDIGTIRSYNRMKTVDEARKIAIFLSHYLSTYSNGEIGLVFKRDRKAIEKALKHFEHNGTLLGKALYIMEYYYDDEIDNSNLRWLKAIESQGE